MSLVLLVVIVAVVLVLVVLVAVSSARRTSVSAPPPVGAVPEDTMIRVRQLLGEGKKIQAIKVFRESQPGMGLKDAKEYVEALEAGHQPALPVAGHGGQPSGPRPMQADTLYRIRQLLGEGKKINAIKELRESQPGMGLKDAKELVEAIEGGYDPPVDAPAAPAYGSSQPAALADHPSDLAERARRLRDTGQETRAIRLVCDETGMGIVDAQAFVRSLS